MKNRIQGEKNIYALIKESEVKLTKLSEYLRRSSWNDLSKQSFYKQPYSLKRLTFELQVAGHRFRICPNLHQQSKLEASKSQPYQVQLQKHSRALTKNKSLQIFW